MAAELEAARVAYREAQRACDLADSDLIAAYEKTFEELEAARSVANSSYLRLDVVSVLLNTLERAEFKAEMGWT